MSDPGGRPRRAPCESRSRAFLDCPASQRAIRRPGLPSQDDPSCLSTLACRQRADSLLPVMILVAAVEGRHDLRRDLLRMAQLQRQP